MVFNVNAGFSGLVNENAEDSENKNYALFVGDTVLVNEVSCRDESNNEQHNLNPFISNPGRQWFHKTSLGSILKLLLPW